MNKKIKFLNYCSKNYEIPHNIESKPIKISFFESRSSKIFSCQRDWTIYLSRDSKRFSHLSESNLVSNEKAGKDLQNISFTHFSTSTLF